MAETYLQNAHLSTINPDFATLVPTVNAAFKQIWTYNDLDEFRGNWRKSPPIYASIIPTDGFDISHQNVTVSDKTEIEIRIFAPQGVRDNELPLLFVLHGGGWVVGGHDSEGSICRLACVRNRMKVLSVDYRRAPEHRYPCALNDGYDVFQWAVAHATQLGFNPDKIVLFGTSSGANLTAALALKLRDSESPFHVAGQILNVPVTCHPKHFPSHKFELNSYEQNAESPTTNATHMRWFWDQYYPNASADPLASPLLAESHANLPPTLIQVGGLDPLRDEGIAYAKALKEAGVETRLEIYPGLPHGFMLAVSMGFTIRYYRTVSEWLEHLLSGLQTRAETDSAGAAQVATNDKA